MILLPLVLLLLALLLAAPSALCFDLHKGTGGLAIYWGQNSLSLQTEGKEEELDLQDYCNSSTPPDIILLAFHHVFTENPQINLSKHCEKYFKGSQMLDCTSLAPQIQACQEKGIKVLLSMGGATGAYSMVNNDIASSYAQTVVDTYLSGNSSDVIRPFGDAVLDGVDLDIEGGGDTGYAEFTNKLREIEPDVLITAAPQCAFPDAMLGDALDNGWVDAVFIQFYNNFCNAGTSEFNFATWADWAQSKSKNPDVKLYIGSPACQACASTGYLGAEKLEQVYTDIKRSNGDVLGGIMLWDAGAAYYDDSGATPIAEQLKQTVLENETFSGSEDISSGPAQSSTVKTTGYSSLSSSASTPESSSSSSAPLVKRVAEETPRTIVGRDAMPYPDNKQNVKHPNYLLGNPYGG
ncbi:Chitinase 2 [Coemansia asiatica]|uniref:chitinase n=1 Tax=Coemansia asiatica TaxID=1052880 RepID=A0A9W7XHI2_9FUNG|nr:Chitinase 2 [Coemansia asiatica]